MKLHQKLRRAIHKYDRTKGMYMQLLRDALDLDELVSIKGGAKKLSLESVASNAPTSNWLKVRLAFVKAFYQVRLQVWLHPATNYVLAQNKLLQLCFFLVFI